MISIRDFNEKDVFEVYQWHIKHDQKARWFWRFLSPNAFLYAFQSTQFYANADPKRFLYRVLQHANGIFGFVAIEKLCDAHAQLHFVLQDTNISSNEVMESIDQLCKEAFYEMQIWVITMEIKHQKSWLMPALETIGFTIFQQKGEILLKRYR